MENDDIGEVLGGIVTHFDVGRGAFLDVAEVYDAFDLDGAFLELVGHIDDYALYQGGAADGLLHAQLTAFHAAREIDLTFASEERNGTHLAEVHADGIVGVDGLFNRGRVKEVGFMSGFRIEEFGVFFEI